MKPRKILFQNCNRFIEPLLVLQRIHFLKFGTFKKVDPWDVVKFGK